MISIFAINPDDSKIAEVAVAFINMLDKRGMTYMLFHELLKLPVLNDSNSFRGYFSSNEKMEEGDIMISIGGDGTFLKAVSLAGPKPVKLMGINAGRLGFLSNIPADKMEAVLEWIQLGKFSVDYRSVLRLEAGFTNQALPTIALNDIVVHKNDSSSMIAIHTYLNGEFLNTYWADGLIVSTPTGSTGYSLSCGGPILYPGSKSLVITPIAPHNLNLRPLVIPDNQVIAFDVESRNGTFMLSFDSYSTAVSEEQQFAVSKADFEVAMLNFEGLEYINTLREKLMWGMDNRNYKT